MSARLPAGEVLIDESLALSEWFGLPVTVRRLPNGEMWADLAEASG